MCPGGHSKNYRGGPHRDIWLQVPTVPLSIVTWAGKNEGRTTFVCGRNDDYCADSLAFTSPKLVWNFCWNSLKTAVLLPLALTQNYRVTAMMKNYPINFKP